MKFGASLEDSIREGGEQKVVGKKKKKKKKKSVDFKVLEYDKCAICNSFILQHCIDCQASQVPVNEECKTAIGVCNHAYHFHCISRWVKTRDTCPLDNEKWEEKPKIESESCD